MRFSLDFSSPRSIYSQLKGPRVLITAGVHGDEYEPMIAARELISIIEDKLIAGSVTIIPVVNSSAYKAGRRFGDDGLDLARICPGNEAGSNSEKAAALVSKAIKDSDYYIDMHTGGKEFNIYPLAGYMLHPSEEILHKQQEMAKAFNLRVIWGTESSPEGRTLSVARDAGIPAIYVEHGGGEPFNNEVVKSYVQGCLNVLISLNMVLPDKKFFSAWQYWVEDYTPQSGHLQSKMPAPAEGIFIPAVVLGDFIKKGHEWGRIVNIHTKSEHIVVADNNGIVLFIRATSFVREGSSLGGVLPVLKPGKTVIE